MFWTEQRKISTTPPNGYIDGGTSPYILQWNPSGTGVGTTVSLLTQGTYTLSVTDSEGCVKVDTFEVS